jgi:DnaJ-domain-containing protein 1
VRTKKKKPKPNVWKREHCRKRDASQGIGNSKQWRAAFHYRMNLDEANAILEDNNPLSILGLVVGFTSRELKKAYLRAAKNWHPDRHPGNEKEAETKFKQAQAAYVKLGGQ